jgi:hypothetical protein
MQTLPANTISLNRMTLAAFRTSNECIRSSSSFQNPNPKKKAPEHVHDIGFVHGVVNTTRYLVLPNTSGAITKSQSFLLTAVHPGQLKQLKFMAGAGHGKNGCWTLKRRFCWRCL